MGISERIFELMKAKNKNQLQLAEFIGVSFKTVSSWKQRGSNPSAEYISAIADFLKVSPEYILTGIEKTSELDAEAAEVLEIWGKLDKANKAIIKGMIYERLEKQCSAKDPKDTSKNK